MSRVSIHSSDKSDGQAHPSSWRPAVIGTLSLGVPISAGMLHPVLGDLVATIEVMIVLTVIGTALFGSVALSERAFRLLRWIRNRPEPPVNRPNRREPS